MSMYKNFRTDPAVEAQGIVHDYGDFRITVARSGGGNRAFAKALEAKTQPYRRAIATGTMDAERSLQIYHEVFAETVVKDWEVKVDGEWKQGIEGPDGSLLPFTVANVVATFKALPDLFLDIKEQSEKTRLFLADVRETDAKN